MSERQVTIEVHATASKYWGCMETLDRNGNLYRKDIEEDRKSTVNGNALQALISALHRLRYSCILDIHTDNEYVVNSIINRWVDNWEQSGWKNAKGDTIPHKEQWQELRKLLANHSASIQAFLCRTAGCTFTTYLEYSGTLRRWFRGCPGRRMPASPAGFSRSGFL